VCKAGCARGRMRVCQTLNNPPPPPPLLIMHALIGALIERMHAENFDRPTLLLIHALRGGWGERALIERVYEVNFETSYGLPSSTGASAAIYIRIQLAVSVSKPEQQHSNHFPL